MCRRVCMSSPRRSVLSVVSHALFLALKSPSSTRSSPSALAVFASFQFRTEEGAIATGWSVNVCNNEGKVIGGNSRPYAFCCCHWYCQHPCVETFRCVQGNTTTKVLSVSSGQLVAWDCIETVRV